MPESALVSLYARRLGLACSEETLQKRAAGSPTEFKGLLDDLLVAHAHEICFETLDVLAASATGEMRGIPTDLDHLSAKLLDAGRGGYTATNLRQCSAPCSPSSDCTQSRFSPASTSVKDGPFQAV